MSNPLVSVSEPEWIKILERSLQQPGGKDPTLLLCWPCSSVPVALFMPKYWNQVQTAEQVEITTCESSYWTSGLNFYQMDKERFRVASASRVTFPSQLENYPVKVLPGVFKAFSKKLLSIQATKHGPDPRCSRQSRLRIQRAAGMDLCWAASSHSKWKTRANVLLEKSSQEIGTVCLRSWSTERGRNMRKGDSDGSEWDVGDVS